MAEDGPVDDPVTPSEEGLHGRARLGVGVLLVTAVLAALVGIGGQLLVDGTGVVPPVPEAADLARGPAASERPETAADDGPDPTNRARQAQTTQLDLAEELLDRQAAAVADGDRKAYLATIDPASPRFAAVAARTFDNLVRLDVQNYRYRGMVGAPDALTPERRAAFENPADPAAEPPWAADVDVEVWLGGRATEPWTPTLRMVFVERDGQLYVANDREGLTRTDPRPLWLDAGVQVVRGEHSLVIGTGSPERLRGYAEAADAGVPTVSDVWKRSWTEHVVIIVPETRAQMEQVLGATSGSQSKVAAVTTSVGREDPQAASHIVVNPETFAGLGSLSRQVILTHEIVHVATGATVSGVPVWLSEGFADYIGFKDSGLAVSTVAQGLLADVRQDGPPEDLPASTEFDPRGTDLDRAYEAAWLACAYIAEQWGEQTLVEFYVRMNDTGHAEEEQLYVDVLGQTPAAFVAGWRDYVAQLAE